MARSRTLTAQRPIDQQENRRFPQRIVALTQRIKVYRELIGQMVRQPRGLDRDFYNKDHSPLPSKPVVVK